MIQSYVDCGTHFGTTLGLLCSGGKMTKGVQLNTYNHNDDDDDDDGDDDDDDDDHD